jgi:hypothetical protein
MAEGSVLRTSSNPHIDSAGNGAPFTLSGSLKLSKTQDYLSDTNLAERKPLSRSGSLSSLARTRGIKKSLSQFRTANQLMNMADDDCQFDDDRFGDLLQQAPSAITKENSEMFYSALQSRRDSHSLGTENNANNEKPRCDLSVVVLSGSNNVPVESSVSGVPVPDMVSMQLGSPICVSALTDLMDAQPESPVSALALTDMMNAQPDSPISTSALADMLNAQPESPISTLAPNDFAISRPLSLISITSRGNSVDAQPESPVDGPAASGKRASKTSSVFTSPEPTTDAFSGSPSMIKFDEIMAEKFHNSAPGDTSTEQRGSAPTSPTSIKKTETPRGSMSHLRPSTGDRKTASTKAHTETDKPEDSGAIKKPETPRGSTTHLWPSSSKSTQK